jgi:DNA-binding response OmpR family regulator
MPPSQSPVALILEDQALIAMDVEYALQNAGFDVHIRSSCSAAEEWLSQNNPQIAVIDITLQDGPCHGIAQILTQRQVPFLVHSGDNASLDQGTPFEAGHWLSKPSSSDQIVSWAQQAIRTELAQDQAPAS